MKKKLFLPLSRGELRAIVVTSLIICLSVVLPPHLSGLLQPVVQPDIEISELKAPRLPSNNAAADYHAPLGTVSEIHAGTGASQNGFDKPRANNSYSGPSTEYAGNDAYAATGKRRGRESTSLHCNTFDPNTITEDSLIAWGLAPYIARNMLKYRSSGGKFRRAEDLSRIYGMDNSTFNQIVSCIEIATEIVRPVFINAADTNQWMSLSGIGPVLSKRIVKFRDKIGGFYTIDQVGDTYGLSAETFEHILPHLRMRDQPKTLNLITATEAQLSSLPYISAKQARVMINYFDQNGRPKAFDELGNLYIADSAWLARIKPYFRIDRTPLN